MKKIINSTFLTSAQNISQCPPPDIAEVVFLGRSNVGKSSLLNTLTNHKNLAKSSSTPGKTQLINLFDIKFKNYDDTSAYLFCRFVDLPGFGYAKVSKSIKEAWGKNLTNFLEQRISIRIFIHLIDARHPLLDIDDNVDKFLKKIKRDDQIIINAFTKIDKLKQNDLRKLKNSYPDGIFISNLKKKGLEDLNAKITEFLFG
jgi:GTP-binding protein